jgi:signal transduction histidine kinase
MTVRLKLALTIFATGLVTALLVAATVVYSFQRFENQTAYRRGMVFLGRVVSMYDNIFDMHERNPEEFQRWLRGLVLFEPDTELYLLDNQGTVLAKTGLAVLRPGFRVALAPVRDSIERMDTSYVMGDDPERMDAGAVVVAKPVQRAIHRDASANAGYLYLVLHTQQLPEGRWDVLRSSFARPVMGLVVAVVAFTTLLALLIISAVTKPLKQLTRALATLSQRGLSEGLTVAPTSPLPAPTKDEFGQLTGAFEMLLDVCRRQWNALRRIDHFRREGVSNLSHDLRSPLTATVACLETLEGRWGESAERADDRRLVEIALRNTRNAARLVQSLGDLAKLDEPEFGLRTETVDAGELLDDIAVRFAERAARLGIALSAVHHGTDGALLPYARVDVELFERAVANLVDNALKFCPRGSSVVLGACRRGDRVEISVSDDGPGIAAADLPQLFDRFYQSRQSVAPATGDGGRGLGLAIVKRIVELHEGEVVVVSEVGKGTRVTLQLPVAST